MQLYCISISERKGCCHAFWNLDVLLLHLFSSPTLLVLYWNVGFVKKLAVLLFYQKVLGQSGGGPKTRFIQKRRQIFRSVESKDTEGCVIPSIKSALLTKKLRSKYFDFFFFSAQHYFIIHETHYIVLGSLLRFQISRIQCFCIDLDNFIKLYRL